MNEKELLNKLRSERLLKQAESSITDALIEDIFKSYAISYMGTKVNNLILIAEESDLPFAKVRLYESYIEEDYCKKEMRSTPHIDDFCITCHLSELKEQLLK